MKQLPSTTFTRQYAQAPTQRDSPVRWALNALRLAKDAGAAIAVQEREGSIYVCVRKGEATSWVPFQKIMTLNQLQGWLRDGGFPRGSDNVNQR